jgi:hypothetical protein
MWEPDQVAGPEDVTTVRRTIADLEAELEHQPAAPSPPPRRRGVRGFIDRYGWRAYALPVLVIVTVVALLTTTGSSGKSHPQGTAGRPATATTPAGTPAPPTASGNIALKSDAPGNNSINAALPANALPAGPAYTLAGNGTYRVIPGTSPVVGATGQLFHYDIEVENGITGIDVNQFASLVQTTLDDPRSWSGHGVRLQRVDSGPVDFHVTLTSSMTVRQLCGYTIPVETSCYAASGSVAGLNVNRVVINDSRWVRGDAAYVGDPSAYRIYMINHEDGHALGHIHAHQCLPGGLAPVMMQQTFGLKSTTGQICQANPWPYPPGAVGAPGAEQPDTPQNSEYGLQNS